MAARVTSYKLWTAGNAKLRKIFKCGRIKPDAMKEHVCCSPPGAGVVAGWLAGERDARASNLRNRKVGEIEAKVEKSARVRTLGKLLSYSTKFNPQHTKMQAMHMKY